MRTGDPEGGSGRGMSPARGAFMAGLCPWLAQARMPHAKSMDVMANT